MAIETALLKIVDLLVGALKYYVQKRKKSSDENRGLERRERLISEAIRELLSRRPNLVVVRARIEEARALGNHATEHLLRAEELLDAVRADTATRPAARRKSATAARTKKKLVRKRPRNIAPVRSRPTHR